MIEAPYSQEAEEAVIGSVLINPNSFYAIRGFLNHDDFYFLRHSYIWQAMERLVDRSEPIDNITLQHELDAIGLLDEIGGAALITHLIANTPTSVHAEVYGRLVERAAIRRRLMVAADEIKVLATDEQLKIEDVMQQAQQKIVKATDASVGVETTWADEVTQFFDNMISIWENPNKTIGIPTGHKAFDKYTLGLQKKWVTLIVGRPAMGKSIILLQWAIAAARAGYKVGFWTGEMAFEQLVKRAVSSFTGIPNHYLNDGSLGVDVRGLTPEQAFEKLKPSRRRLQDSERMFVSLPIVGKWDKADITVSELKMNVLKAQSLTGLDILFVDYADLMTSGRQHENQTGESTAISKGLKALANSCDIPIVVGQQLNRECESRQDKRPLLSDIRSSGSYEQDADLVIALYRDDYYNEFSQWPGMIELLVRKSRHGGTPTFYGKFDGATSTITETNLRQFNTGG